MVTHISVSGPYLHQGGAVLEEAQNAVADVADIAAHLEVEVYQVGVQGAGLREGARYRFG